MTRNMGYGEFSDFYFSRQPKYGHSKNVLKYPPIGAILRGVLQQPPEGGWDQTKYGHGHTPWVLDQPWYQNRVTRFGHFSLGFEGLANEHLRNLKLKSHEEYLSVEQLLFSKRLDFQAKTQS